MVPKLSGSASEASEENNEPTLRTHISLQDLATQLNMKVPLQNIMPSQIPTDSTGQISIADLLQNEPAMNWLTSVLHDNYRSVGSGHFPFLRQRLENYLQNLQLPPPAESSHFVSQSDVLIAILQPPIKADPSKISERFHNTWNQHIGRETISHEELLRYELFLLDLSSVILCQDLCTYKHKPVSWKDLSRTFTDLIKLLHGLQPASSATPPEMTASIPTFTPPTCLEDFYQYHDPELASLGRQDLSRTDTSLALNIAISPQKWEEMVGETPSVTIKYLLENSEPKRVLGQLADVQPTSSLPTTGRYTAVSFDFHGPDRQRDHIIKLLSLLQETPLPYPSNPHTPVSRQQVEQILGISILPATWEYYFKTDPIAIRLILDDRFAIQQFRSLYHQYQATHVEHTPVNQHALNLFVRNVLVATIERETKEKPPSTQLTCFDLEKILDTAVPHSVFLKHFQKNEVTIGEVLGSPDFFDALDVYHRTQQSPFKKQKTPLSVNLEPLKALSGTPERSPEETDYFISREKISEALGFEKHYFHNIWNIYFPADEISLYQLLHSRDGLKIIANECWYKEHQPNRRKNPKTADTDQYKESVLTTLRPLFQHKEPTPESASAPETEATLEAADPTESTALISPTEAQQQLRPIDDHECNLPAVCELGDVPMAMHTNLNWLAERRQDPSFFLATQKLQEAITAQLKQEPDFPTRLKAVITMFETMHNTPAGVTLLTDRADVFDLDSLLDFKDLAVGIGLMVYSSEKYVNEHARTTTLAYLSALPHEKFKALLDTLDQLDVQMNDKIGSGELKKDQIYERPKDPVSPEHAARISKLSLADRLKEALLTEILNYELHQISPGDLSLETPTVEMGNDGDHDDDENARFTSAYHGTLSKEEIETNWSTLLVNLTGLPTDCEHVLGFISNHHADLYAHCMKILVEQAHRSRYQRHWTYHVTNTHCSFEPILKSLFKVLGITLKGLNKEARTSFATYAQQAQIGLDVLDYITEGERTPVPFETSVDTGPVSDDSEPCTAEEDLDEHFDRDDDIE